MEEDDCSVLVVKSSEDSKQKGSDNTESYRAPDNLTPEIMLTLNQNEQTQELTATNKNENCVVDGNANNKNMNQKEENNRNNQKSSSEENDVSKSSVTNQTGYISKSEAEVVAQQLKVDDSAQPTPSHAQLVKEGHDDTIDVSTCQALSPTAEKPQKTLDIVRKALTSDIHNPMNFVHSLIESNVRSYKPDVSPEQDNSVIILNGPEITKGNGDERTKHVETPTHSITVEKVTPTTDPSGKLIRSISWQPPVNSESTLNARSQPAIKRQLQHEDIIHQAIMRCISESTDDIDKVELPPVKRESNKRRASESIEPTAADNSSQYTTDQPTQFLNYHANREAVVPHEMRQWGDMNTIHHTPGGQLQHRIAPPPPMKQQKTMTAHPFRGAPVQGHFYNNRSNPQQQMPYFQVPQVQGERFPVDQRTSAPFQGQYKPMYVQNNQASPNKQPRLQPLREMTQTFPIKAEKKPFQNQRQNGQCNFPPNVECVEQSYKREDAERPNLPNKANCPFDLIENLTSIEQRLMYLSFFVKNLQIALFDTKNFKMLLANMNSRGPVPENNSSLNTMPILEQIKWSEEEVIRLSACVRNCKDYAIRAQHETPNNGEVAGTGIQGVKQTQPYQPQTAMKQKVPPQLQPTMFGPTSVKPSAIPEKPLDLTVKVKTSTENSVLKESSKTTSIIPMNKWNYDQVYRFVASVPLCSPYAQEFINHSIDGATLMHLNEDHLVKLLGSKIGPAIKLKLAIKEICSAIESGN
ncbi:unnamed protein product [Owenia fusiformis]|uniref:SAM domain-containing protein n=1 Tax=Owenia fusiformis TaxID=6347 RepID=A0A8S4N3D9_OWEFU|nr:unnamed protein product [Owenia fusiformis]